MFTKFDWEERYRYYQFKRPDGQDGLAVGEVLLSADSVTCFEITSPFLDRSSTMISNVAIYSSTQVTYLLKGGETGKNYIVTVKATTTLGQKLEGTINIGIK